MQSKLAFLKMLCIGLALGQSDSACAEIHGTVTGATNYVWRMYSKSNNEPVIQETLITNIHPAFTLVSPPQVLILVKVKSGKI